MAWGRLKALVGAGGFRTGWPRVAGDDLPQGLQGELIDPATRPDLRLLELEAAAAGLDREAAERGWIPELVVSAGWRSAAEDARDHGFVAGLALDLPIFDDGSARADRARALQAQAITEGWLRAEVATNETEAARDRTTGLTRAASDFQTKSAAASEALIRTAEFAYAGGELGLVSLLDAYRAATNDALRVLEVDLRARDAATELWAATKGTDR